MKLRSVALPALVAAVLVLSGAATAGRARIYAKGVPVCKVPKHFATAHRATCDAMRRVLVSPGTKGAWPYTPGAGAVDAGSIGPDGGLTPSDIVAAYHLLSSGGSSQTVAIVDAYNDPNIQADLATFDAHYGLPCSGCLTVYDQSGQTSGLPANDTTGWSVEETLDVEAVHGLCPSCHIDLVEANSPSDSDLAAATSTAGRTLHATEISNSYGGPEGSSTTVPSAYNQPGVVITASAGDDGYFDFDRWVQKVAGAGQPNAPASYPTVVAVGGTSLYLSQGATAVARAYETVWNDNGPQGYYENSLGQPLGATGGGCSTDFAAQGWQAHATNFSQTACGAHRLVSDVAMVGDPLTGYDIYDSYACGSQECPTSGTWMTLGGTSLSAPLAAAAFALEGGARGVPYPAVTLYGHSSAVYDVVTGGNGYCGGEGAAQCADPDIYAPGVLDCAWTASHTPTVAAGDRACDALPGLDGPTGVGTPSSNALFAKTGPTIKITGLRTATANAPVTFGATATDPFPGGTITHYVFDWGDRTATTTVAGISASGVTHTFTTGSGVKRTVTVTATDSYGVTGSKTLTVTVS